MQIPASTSVKHQIEPSNDLEFHILKLHEQQFVLELESLRAPECIPDYCPMELSLSVLSMANYVMAL